VGKAIVFSKNGKISLKIANFSYFKNKILKKNSSICKKNSPKKKERKKKKPLHGERLFFVSG
jgi:hypothetical protein